ATMRILPLLLLLAGSSSAAVFFSATAHHKEITEGLGKDIAEKYLLREFRSLIESTSDVQIKDTRISSLDGSSVLLDILITFQSEISRDSILKSLEERPLRLIRLSQAHSSAPPPRSLSSLSSPISILNSSSDLTPCSGHGVKLPNATCVCDNFWVGEQCDELLCFGGVAQYGRCSCPPGRFAEHCQPQTCMPPMNDNLSLKRRSIVVALNLRNTMARDLQYIIPDLGSTIEELAKAHTDTYDHFVLYSYLSFANSSIDDVFETDDMTKFFQALQEVAISKGDDRQPTLGALRKAINASPLIHPRSIIMLFADSLPSDSTDWAPSENDQTEEVQLIEQILAYGHRLVITLTDQPNVPLDPEDEDFESLDRVTSTVHGDLIHTAKNDIPTTTQYFTPLLHQSENVFIKSRFTCGQETDTIVEIDHGVDEYYVAFAGTDKVQLFAQGAGAESEQTSLLTVQNFVVFKVPSSLTSIRVITPTNSAPFCSFRVFVQSPDAVLVSFSHDENIDVGSATATQGANQYISLFSSQPDNSHKIQMRDMNGNGLGAMIDLSMRTETCAFTMQTLSDATCMAGPIHMKVTAVRADGQRTFTRVVPAMCEKPAVRSPDPWVCLNGGEVVPTSQGGEACQCARLFDGAHCEIPQCHNGASRNQFPVDGEPLCLCQIGWAGRHCETLADCPAPVDADFSVANRQFILVIQVSFSQNFIYDDIISALRAIETIYGSYVLVTYNRVLMNGSPVDNIDRSEFDSVQGIIDQLDKVKYTYAGSDNQPIAKAISTALGNKANRNDAIVFVITDTDDISYVSDVVEMKKSATQAGAPLHVIRTQQFGDTCPPFDDQKISGYARETGGVYVDTCADGSSNDEVAQTITSLSSHPNNTQLVDVQTHYYEDCTDLTFNLQYRKNEDEGLFIRIVSESTLDSEVNATRIFDKTDLETNQTLSLNTIHEWSLPTEIGDLGVDRFLATVSVKSGGGCAVFLLAHSPDSLWYSYGEMENDTKDRNAYFGKSTFPRVHLQVDEQSGLTPGADFYVYDMYGNETYKSSAGELRGNCSYELLYPNEMACPVHRGGYLVQATVSHFDSLVQRTWFAYCALEADYDCVHGSWNGEKCGCYSSYDGDYCEIPQCIHGVYDNGVCACEKGYIGTFCDYAMCDAPNFMTASDERGRDFRTVTFIMELTNNAITANIMFQPKLADIVNSIDNSYTTKQFNLITYDDEVVTFAASSSVATQFITEFNRIITAANHKKTTPNTTKAFTAIDQAMQMNVAQPNLIIAFVSASSSPKLDEFTRMRNQHPGVQVNIIYTPYNQPSDPMLPTSSPYYLYEAATYMSGGRVIPTSQLNAFWLTDVITSMATEDVLLTAEGASDCTGNYTATFEVDSTANRLVVQIIGTGVDPSKVVVEHQGEVMAYTVRRDLFWDSAAYSFEINSLSSYGTGPYRVIAATTMGRCNIQARLQAKIRTEIGFVTDPHDDFVRDLPFTGNADKDHKNTRFAVTVPTSNAKSINFNTADLYEFDFTTGKRTGRGGVDIGLRDYGGVSIVNPGCAYQYISEPFTLPSTYTSIVLKGSDKERGENIQRTFIVSNLAQECNGGQFKPTGECICPDGFTGDSCDTALCSNGGSSSGSICICTSGYTGPHCEEISSPNPTTTTKTTTIPTTASTAGSTDTETTTPTTTTLPTTTKTVPICYPDSTSYNIAMFIENSKFSFSTPEAASSIILGMAATYQLGVDLGRSQTAFMMTGVNKEFFYDGQQQSVLDINNAINDIEDSLDGSSSNVFNLGLALSNFTSDHMAEFTETKPFAVVFTGMKSSDDASGAVKNLIDADYSFVGIAFTPDAEKYLLTLTENVYLFTNDVDEAAQFVVNATCAV
ncbi:hypothetical protein PENTCL1PPCAC_26698, partial [Pristionchus entomophagus]